MGASLNQSYFAKTFNLFIALAPVGKVGNIGVEMLRIASSFADEIIAVVVNTMGIYNWLPAPMLAQEAIIALCNNLTFICEGFNALFFGDASHHGEVGGANGRRLHSNFEEFEYVSNDSLV